MNQRLNWSHYRWLVTLLAILLVLMLGACNTDKDPAPQTKAPTIQPTETELPASNTPTPSVTPGGPTLTPSPTFPPTVTPQPQQNDAVVVGDQPTIAPTDTPPPYIHRVEENQTCGEIALRYGLEFSGGSAAIAEANQISCNALQVGQNIIVPRPSGTPTPQGLDATQTAVYTALPPSLRNVTPYAIYEYCPVDDDNLTSIALKTGTTQKRLCELNPLPDGLDCRGCDFSESSVGFCPRPPLVSLNKCLKVPGPTHTPTPTATFTGLETATPIPTYGPPMAIQPANGATMRGALQLIWISAGELAQDEYYEIGIINEQTGENLFHIVKSTSFVMPQSWFPAAGQAHNILWSVKVIRLDGSSGLHIPVSGISQNYRFVWQG